MKIANTFLDGINTDLADLVIKKSMVRLGQNFRIINLESSTYAITNLSGTEQAFTLSSGFIPLAAKQFDNVIYILSINPDTSVCELGSFGSPDYTLLGGSQELYRPFNNLQLLDSDQSQPINWSQSGGGAAWGNYSSLNNAVTLATATGLSSANLELAVSILAGPTTIHYSAFIHNLFTKVETVNLTYDFLDSLNNVVYTKTFTYTDSLSHNIDVKEFVTIGTDIAKIRITALTSATPGGSDNVVYHAYLVEMKGGFRTTAFGYTENSGVKMELQPEYDGSINVIMFEKNNPPRIVNSKLRRNSSDLLEEAPDRPGNATSNVYDASTIDEETKLLLFSSTILKIALSSIQSGGKLKYGTYRYFFAYMTEDFNRTEIIGQSGLCAVFTGSSMNTLKGGDSTQETDKRVALTLSNLDQTYKFVKVYVLYSSGVEGLEQQMLEFTTPTEITGSSMTFYHTGFELVTEISQDVVNTAFQSIDTANTGTQIGGFLIAGGTTEQSVDLTQFQDAASNVKLNQSYTAIPYTGSLSVLEGYADVTNIYNKVGHFCGEAYAFRMVFILPGGKLTPPFLVQGIDYESGGTPRNDNGVIRFQKLNNTGGVIPYDGANINSKFVHIDLSSVPSQVRDASIGFFFVRAERVPNLITQGYLIPTLLVPPIEFLDSNNTYYNRNLAGTEALYKNVPSLDNILEAYERDTATGGGDLYVVDINNNNKLNYYFPIFINHCGSSSKNPGGATPNLSTYVNNYPQSNWAFISADDLANESSLITSIAKRSGMYCNQLAKVNMQVKGQITPLPSSVEHGATINAGLFYDTTSFSKYTSSIFKSVDTCEYVPAESFATGSIFSSRVYTRYKVADGSGGTAYGVDLYYNPYFGMQVSNLTDGGAGGSSDYNANTPRPGNQRLNPTDYISGKDTSGVAYDNYNSTLVGAFLVNIYPSNGLLPLTSLYPDTDSLIYKQVGPRFEWADMEVGDLVSIYDGDCYVTKSYRKLYQSGSRDPFTPLTNINIDSGMVLSLFQETPYNTYLRSPNRFDASESEDRSFYPYQSKGDFDAFRRYRYPETSRYNQGFTPPLPSLSFIPESSLAPFIQTNFFSRLAYSARHIPNAFANGYRFFTGNNFRDYDPSMGKIVGLEAFHNILVVIFEHGVAALAIEARILTGQDPAGGPVYALPGTVLPPNFGQYFSRYMGCQHPKAILQTPSAIYAMDADKKKIWQLRESLNAISDSQVASFLEQNPMVNPRIGYDFKNNEVLFTTDNWTLCFREGLERFTDFYSFTPNLYASRGGDFYSFFPISGSEIWHKHNSTATRQIYGEDAICFVEFVVPCVYGPDEKPLTLVYDVLEIFSNEVPPTKIECFTYEKESKRLFTISPAACGQYTHIDNTTDFFKQESPITFRDKRFLVQIPNTEYYKSAIDIWGVGGRMRNTHMIIRLTYDVGDEPLQLSSVLTTFRVSKS